MSTPSRLGRYPVRRRIGSGAFATVWLAYDEHLDSPVAIKVLADNWAGDLHVRQRFVEEGRFLRKVESPHVVAVYDAGELPDGRPYLVMSYADQGTLADRLELAPLTIAQARHVVGQVGAGLHALHQRGVLHRDVKPGNVLFRTVEVDGRAQVSAMLGDLGLGKAMDMSSRLTMISGTPSFVAPEQAQGEPLDPRADQYSLAALTYLLLAGRPPYDHASLAAAAAPAPPPPMGGDLPEAVEAVVRRALSTDREGRYGDLPAFVAALEEALGEHDREVPAAWMPLDPELTQAAARPVPGDGPGATDPAGPELPAGPGVPRRRWPRVLAAAVAVALGVLGGYALQSALVTEHRVDDSTGTISVTVPERWLRAVDTSQWVPPDSAVDFPALSAGSAPGWGGTEAPGHGVFVGLLAGDRLPTRVPQHPGCSDVRPTVDDEQDGDASMTVLFTGCRLAGATDGVTVERVVQVTANQLLWVQVRAADRGTVNRVLDAVELHGM